MAKQSVHEGCLAMIHVRCMPRDLDQVIRKIGQHQACYYRLPLQNFTKLHFREDQVPAQVATASRFTYL